MNPKVAEIWKVKLYPVRGSEQNGIRPCLFVSPNSMNSALQTIIVVTLTNSFKNWPTRVSIQVEKNSSQACLEQIRSVSKERFLKKIGKSTDLEMALVRKHLKAIFTQ